MKTFLIDNAAHVVLLECSGVVENSDLKIGFNRDPKYSCLIDLSAVEEFRCTWEAIRAAAISWGREPLKYAVIAPSSVAFGLARMYQTQSENSDMVVFRDAASAREWLGLASFPIPGTARKFSRFPIRARVNQAPLTVFLPTSGATGCGAPNPSRGYVP